MENLTTTAAAFLVTLAASTSLAPTLHHQPTKLNRALAWDQDSIHSLSTTFAQRLTTTAYICPLPAKNLISLRQACTLQDCRGRCGPQQEVEEEGLGADQMNLKVSQSLAPVSGVKVCEDFLAFSFLFPQRDHWMVSICRHK